MLYPEHMKWLVEPVPVEVGCLDVADKSLRSTLRRLCEEGLCKGLDIFGHVTDDFRFPTLLAR